MVNFQVVRVIGLLVCGFYFSLVGAVTGKDFMAANDKQAGVVTTPSGLQYKVVSEGSGPSPAATDLVKVHYHGTLIDGTVFDSSVERGSPTSFALNRVIKGWTEGLQTMKQGGKTTFYIPPDIAYGSKAVGPIPPNSTLVFEVELLRVFKLNTPSSLDEVKAFKIASMDCGTPPELPANKDQLKSVQRSADTYSTCAQDYYKYVTMQMEGLMGLLEGNDEDMRDAVLDKLRDSKKAVAVQLDPVITFLDKYQALQTM